MRRSLVLTLQYMRKKCYFLFYRCNLSYSDDPHLGTGLAFELTHNREGLKAGLTLALKIVPPEQLKKNTNHINRSIALLFLEYSKACHKKGYLKQLHQNISLQPWFTYLYLFATTGKLIKKNSAIFRLYQKQDHDIRIGFLLYMRKVFLLYEERFPPI